MRGFWLAQCLAVAIASGQVDVLTANYNNNRTSANLAETRLSVSDVGPTTFGRVGGFPVTGQIYAQPLVVTGLDVPACGTCDVVFVATMENNVYAFNATTLEATPLWSVNLGESVLTSLLGFGAINPTVGVLSTPVIDRSRDAIYLVSEIMRDDAPVFQLHALDLKTGKEILNGPSDITAAVPGTGDASADGFVTLDALQHLPRPGLLAANNRIYIAFGSIFDRYPYHGWVLAYNMDDVSKQTAVFNSTPYGGNGGIWQSGRGLVADVGGNIYLGVGNGDYDGLNNFGESFLRLSPDLRVVDWFTPADWQTLSTVDLDTASLGPILIPSINMLLGGDKNNDVYLIDRFNMGHLGLTGASVPQAFKPIGSGGLFNSAVWDRSSGPLAYFVEEGVATSAWRITDGQFEAAPFSITPTTSDYPWQGIAVSASGDADGSGILWMTTGDHNQLLAPGTLVAFNAQDLTQVLWSSEMNARRDRLGRFAKFATPTIANGLVFVPTFSNRVVVYGLLENGPTRSSKSAKQPMY